MQLLRTLSSQNGIIISKATTFKKFIKEYKIIDFPGICWKCQISHYDVNCKDSKQWLDKYRSLMNDSCKWVVNDDSYTHVVVRLLDHGAKDTLLGICSRDRYDKKGKLPCKRILLKLTDEEFNKLTSYTNPLYEDYHAERYTLTQYVNVNILYGYINRALSNASTIS